MYLETTFARESKEKRLNRIAVEARDLWEQMVENVGKLHTLAMVEALRRKPQGLLSGSSLSIQQPVDQIVLPDTVIVGPCPDFI